MATISSLGVGTGLDLESIVTGLMDIERQPLDRLESKQSTINAQISAYGSFKSKLSTFQSAMESLSSASSFKVFQANSQDEDLFTATATSTAATGSYNIDVTQIATRDKLASSAFTDYNTTVGEGTLTISVGSESFDVTIDSSNSSLAQIRTAINNASENTGVTASIITDDSGARLVLTSNETGTDNAISVSVSGDSDGNDSDASGLSAFVYSSGGTQNLSSISSAKDAIVSIDGFTVTSSSNSIANAIDGVTLNVKDVGSSTLDITRDDDAILESVNEFASAYNALMTEIKSQRNGQLEADSTLLTIESQVRDVFNSGASITGSSFSYLIQAGISINKEGVMTVDEDKVNEVLSSDFTSFANLFSAEGEGFANRLESLADSWLQTDGLIDSKEEGLNARLTSLDRQKEQMEARLEMTETRLRAQYSAMDTLVSNLQSQGDYLISQLSSMNSN
ncbi:flagellar hook-associated protein 2 [Methylophaga thalassica]|uniref:Flagellar hook-associated protein 2 n=1 Tax=Methylophaga thalassica TaxID=40223 RepID=A0ABQ5U2K8_9GAMM|nr:flagellar filament capping protein FliD [Methylophaga thalassica]GLQ01076.1 flagellar hook-associated protein 2 [Methylophaga thalassica]